MGVGRSAIFLRGNLKKKTCEKLPGHQTVSAAEHKDGAVRNCAKYVVKTAFVGLDDGNLIRLASIFSCSQQSVSIIDSAFSLNLIFSK